MRNADNWGLAFIVFGTAAIVWALPAKPVRSDQTVAKASPMTVPADTVDYKITVAARKTPAECKTLGPDSESALIAHCQTITTQGTQMTMVPVNATVQVASQPE